MKCLITGSSGFIGYHVAKNLINSSNNVIGIDNHNDYYDVELKKSRLNQLLKLEGNFDFFNYDLNDNDKLKNLFENNEFDVVIHLAAQAGVRYSIENPKAYIKSNIDGFFNILDLSKDFKVPHLIFASSSSVYGNNSEESFSTSDFTDSPVSLYAASKKSNELMAHSYASLYQMKITGLRFFTVYGEWGRPDMAYYSFAQKIFKGEQINLFNNGNLERDFTYISDIVDGINNVMKIMPNYFDKKNYEVPFELFNLGNNKPSKLRHFVQTIEKYCGKAAKLNFVEMQKGDVFRTAANLDKEKSIIKYNPVVDLDSGIKNFINWYKDYHK